MFKHDMLDNGMEVLSFSNMSLNSFCIGLYFKAGPLYEPDNLIGISHLIEHMFFRETAKWNQSQIYSAVNRIGGDYYGATYYGHIGLSVQASKGFFKEALGIISQVLEDHTYSLSAVESEKGVVERQIQNKPWPYFTEASREHYLIDTVYNLPIMGSSDSLNALSLNSINLYKRKITDISNSCCIMTGCFSKEEYQFALSLLNGFCSAKDAPLRSVNRLPYNFKNRDTASDFFTRKASTKDLIADVVILFDIDLTKVNEYAASILASIIAQGNGSVLGMELREKYAYTDEISATILEYRGFSTLELFYSTDMSSLKASLELLFSILSGIKKMDIEKEMNENILFYTDNKRWDYDSPFGLQQELVWRRIELERDVWEIEDVIRQYKQLRPADIASAARSIFKASNMCAYISYNESSISEEELRTWLDACREKLDN